LGISPGNLNLKGLAKIAKDLGLLNITLKMFFDITKIMGIDLKELVDAFEAIYFSGALLDLIPGVLPIYAPVISNYDPSLAPEGKQLIQSSTATAPKPDGKPWEDWIKATYGATCSVIPGVKEQTLWYDSATPEDLEKFLGKEGGSAFSTAQIVGQTGERRFKNKSPIDGLYFAGDNAGGWGIGVELAAKSAIDCVYLITKADEIGVTT